MPIAGHCLCFGRSRRSVIHPRPGVGRYTGWRPHDSSGWPLPCSPSFVRFVGLTAVLLALSFPMSSHGQGTVVFANIGVGFNAPFFELDGQTELMGDDFLAQLFVGPGDAVDDSALRPVAQPQPFLVDSGYILSTVLAVPGFPEQSEVAVQVRAWSAQQGDDYETAVARGAKHGRSNLIRVTLGGGCCPPSVPATLTGLESVTLIQAWPAPTDPDADQYNTAIQREVFLNKSVTLAQTFTPGISGQLVGLVIYPQFDDPIEVMEVPARLVLRDTRPDGAPGETVLGEVFVDGDAWFFPMESLKVYLTAGVLYAVEFQSPNNNPSIGLGLGLSTNDQYDRGSLWRRDPGAEWTLFGDDIVSPGDADLAFETVMIPGVPPVRLVKPMPNTLWPVGDEMELTAVVTPEAGSVASIEFTATGTTVAEAVSEPYSARWIPRATGPFEMRAIVRNQAGLMITSDAVGVEIIPEVPANDRFADAIAIEGFRYETHTSNANATREDGEVRYGDNQGDHSIWYRWTAPADGICAISGQLDGFSGGGEQLLIVAYTGDSLDRLQVIDSKWSGIARNFEFPAVAGQQYWISIDSLLSDYSGFLTWAMVLRPDNDLFANRKLVSGAALDDAASSFGASIEVDEPHDPQSPVRASMWYAWQSPVAGPVALRVNSEAFSPHISVFKGVTVTELETVAALDSTWIDEMAELRFSAEDQVPYVFRIASRDNRSGPYQFHLDAETIRVESPLNGSVVPSNTVVPIRTLPAADPEDVASVRVTVDGVFLVEFPGAPFGMDWLPDTPGSFRLRAESLLVNGDTRKSEPSDIYVYEDRELPRPRVFTNPGDNLTFAINASGTLSRWGGLNLQDPDESPEVPPDGSWEPPVWTDEQIRQRFNHHVPRWVAAPVSPNDIQSIIVGQKRASYRTVWILDRFGRLFENDILLPFPPEVGSWIHIDANVSNSSFTGLSAIGDNGKVYRKYQEEFELVNLTPSGDRFVQVAVGYESRSVLTRMNTLVIFGGWAALHRATISFSNPNLVWMKIDAEGRKGYALSENGRLISWSANNPWTQTTIPATEIRPPAGAGRWVDFDCGGNHTLALGDDGQLYSWGRNWEGQLGLGPSAGQEETFEPRRVPLPDGVSAWSAFAAGFKHSLAIGDDCRLYSWGENDTGQLGIGVAPNQRRPRQVASLRGLCGIPVIVSSSGQMRLPDGRVEIRFVTDRNLSYQVQYSGDAIEWKPVVPEVHGTGGLVSWFDSGPPQTETAPATTLVRYYRVLVHGQH